MADLNSRSKRASSVNLLKSWGLSLVLPDATLDQGDRQHIAWAYSGIAATTISTNNATRYRYGYRQSWKYVLAGMVAWA